MLFQCEKGRHKGCVRIRSRATNTFLYFLGIKQPLTWVVSRVCEKVAFLGALPRETGYF